VVEEGDEGRKDDVSAEWWWTGGRLRAGSGVQDVNVIGSTAMMCLDCRRYTLAARVRLVDNRGVSELYSWRLMGDSVVVQADRQHPGVNVLL
jgi:hypothetical protein